MTVDKDLIFNIFDIKQDGSNIRDDDDLGTNSDQSNKIPFDKKVIDVQKEIADVVNNAKSVAVENSTNTQKEVPPLPPTEPSGPYVGLTKTIVTPEFALEVKKETVESKKEANKSEVKKVETIQGNSKSSKSVDSEESADVLFSEIKKEREKNKILEAEKIDSKKERLIENGNRWKLSSSDEKYKYFYDQKKEAIENDLLHGGEIDFNKSFTELELAHVDVSVGETFVPDLVCKRLEEVQKWRDRIKLIQLRVNRQYFIWDRIINLFDGLLKRTEYDRGKNEGIRFEHMYDMDVYFGSLESLHKSVSAVMANLDGAFECLSRQVTVVMPTKDIERYNKPAPKQLDPLLKQFDGLKTNANSSTSMGTSYLNEAGKTAEPSSKSDWDNLL